MSDSNYPDQTIVSDNLREGFGQEIEAEIGALAEEYAGYLRRIHILESAKDRTRQDVERMDQVMDHIAEKLGISAELRQLESIRMEQVMRFRDAVEATSPPERGAK